MTEVVPPAPEPKIPHKKTASIVLIVFILMAPIVYVFLLGLTVFAAVGFDSGRDLIKGGDHFQGIFILLFLFWLSFGPCMLGLIVCRYFLKRYRSMLTAAQFSAIVTGVFFLVVLGAGTLLEPVVKRAPANPSFSSLSDEIHEGKKRHPNSASLLLMDSP